MTHHWDLNRPTYLTCLCGFPGADPRALEHHRWLMRKRGEKPEKHIPLSVAVEQGLVALPVSEPEPPPPAPLARALRDPPWFSAVGPRNGHVLKTLPVVKPMVCKYRCGFELKGFNPRGMSRHYAEVHGGPPEP